MNLRLWNLELLKDFIRSWGGEFPAPAEEGNPEDLVRPRIYLLTVVFTDIDHGERVAEVTIERPPSETAPQPDAPPL